MNLAAIGITGIIILLLILFFLGTPVGFAMGIVGFCGFCYVISLKAGLNMIGSVLWETFSKYGLTVIPLFIFMGQIAFYSGINEKLYNAAYNWVGQIRGGIAMATVIACSAFAAICGSNAATAATMTTVALPQMNKYKYKPILSTSVVDENGSILHDPDEIIQLFHNRADIILDGGPLISEPSTVIDLTAEIPEILRHGAGDTSLLE